MLIFANEYYLLLLLLVPVIPLVYGILCVLRRRRVRKFGDESLVRELMPSFSAAKGWTRVILFDMALLCFVIGLARPRIGAKLSEREIRGSEIIICLDVSNSMLAEDYSPNRLQRAKLAISRLAEDLQDDRLGLVVFAGTSFVQLPVTTDYVSAKMFLNSINTDAVPIQGTAIGDAIHTAMKSFSGQNDKGRAIVIISDGENHEDDPVSAAEDAAGEGIRVFTIGVGSSEGQPIPVEGELLKDSEGNIIVSHLDEDTLKKIAEAGNGAYFHAGRTEFGLGPIIGELRRLEKEKMQSVVFEEYSEQYMYFMAAALFFLVVEMLVGERRARRKLFDR